MTETKKTALVTGASAGLGAELSWLFAADGHRRASRALEERAIEVEFLVNNAGFGTTGAFAELDLKRELEMVQVDVTAVLHLTRLFLPAMVARRSGDVDVDVVDVVGDGDGRRRRRGPGRQRTCPA